MQIQWLKKLASSEVQAFIKANESCDERDVVLRSSHILDIPSVLIAQQIAGRRKAKYKLPSYYSTDGVVYPPSINMEQASSEKSAIYKVNNLFSGSLDNHLLIDLSGGFGVDSYFFSKRFRRIIYVEPESYVLEVAKHNHSILGVDNIDHVHSSAEEFLTIWRGQASGVYADPSRRTEGNRKVYGLKECKPDVTLLQKEVFRITRDFTIKASPLLDIKGGLKELSNVKAVTVLAVDNDCKELLFETQVDFSGEARIITSNLIRDYEEILEFTFLKERQTAARIGAPGKFIFEPNVAVLKAGAFKIVGESFGLSKLDPNTHLFTGDHIMEDFPGRIFQVQATISSDPKQARIAFPDSHANIISRNYPLSVAELKKKLKLEEGGVQYLIATSAEGKRLLIVATRIK